MLRLEPRQTYDKHIIGTARDFKGVVIFVYDEDSIIDMLADEFKEDKTAIVTDEDGTQDGTWSVDDKTLIVTFDDEPQTLDKFWRI